MSNVLQRRQRRSTAATSVDPVELSRIRDWMEREIRFVDHSCFRQKESESCLRNVRPPSLDQTAEPAVIGHGIVFVATLIESPLLTHSEEAYLFTWMNFLKYRAEKLRRRLSLNAPDASMVDRIESDVAEATSVRNRIVSSNLRLVVSLAKQLANSVDEMADLIGEASVPLIRAVELFDVSQGNRFSTYATWAVRNQMLRTLKRERRTRDRTLIDSDCVLDRLPETRTCPVTDALHSRQDSNTVERLVASLSCSERRVIAARFGLDGQPRGQSLREIADVVGLSKERVRQIVIRSIEKLRGIATELDRDQARL